MAWSSVSSTVARYILSSSQRHLDPQLGAALPLGWIRTLPPTSRTRSSRLISPRPPVRRASARSKPARRR